MVRKSTAATDLGRQLIHLSRCQPRVGKHANLHALDIDLRIISPSKKGTCEVMWPQSCLLPRSSRFFFSNARMLMMRSAIPFTSPSHCWLRSGSSRIFAAIRAPWTGGFEYSGRTRIFTCESTRFFSSLESQTMENAPTRSP